MSIAFVMNINGIRTLRRTLGVLESSITNQKPVYEAIIRKHREPGMPNWIMRKEYTLENSVREAFENGGRNVYRGPWRGYDNEPRYAAMKLRAGGGTRVGTWEGSKNPLSETFRDKFNEDHVEIVEDDGFEWGSKRRYAAGFSAGGRFQMWDKVMTPARNVITVNETFSLEVARAYQRHVIYSIKARGGDPSEFGMLRVEP